MLKNCYQATNSGIMVDLLDPHPDMFTIQDIAASLSKICRFTGHCDRFYSVAEHCLHGAKILNAVNIEWAYEFLLHDAHEAYVGDLHTNLKKICPDYQAIESRIDVMIRQKFGLPLTITPEVKKMDLMMLAVEKKEIMKNCRDVEWEVLKGVGTPNIKLNELGNPKTIEKLFLSAYYRYCEDL